MRLKLAMLLLLMSIVALVASEEIDGAENEVNSEISTSDADRKNDTREQQPEVSTSPGTSESNSQFWNLQTWKSQILSFDRFKKLFDKHYDSVLEEISRKRLFLSRALSAFLSKIKFQQKRQDFYLAVNHMSDRTVEELKRMRMYFNDAPNSPMVQADERQMSQQQNLARDQPTIMKTTQSQNVFGYLWSKITNTKEQKDVETTNTEATKKRDISFEINHLKSGCFTPVKDQKTCGSCYIFSVIALYEFMHCKQTGRLVEFSEQVVLDCGKLTDNGGCRGGTWASVNDYVDKYGVELAEYYPYTGYESECPFESLGDSQKEQAMGYLRFGESPMGSIYFRDQILESLRNGPLLVHISISSHFYQYGGGIDNPEVCGGRSTEAHGALLVGFGQENGKEFWLIRNSHSTNWGENGYYRLKADSECLKQSFGIVAMYIEATMGDDPDKLVNPNHHRQVASSNVGNKRSALDRFYDSYVRPYRQTFSPSDIWKL